MHYRKRRETRNFFNGHFIGFLGVGYSFWETFIWFFPVIRKLELDASVWFEEDKNFYLRINKKSEKFFFSQHWDTSKKFDLLGTPETSLRGLSTRIALRVLRSRPSSASLELSESPTLSSELRMVMYLMMGGGWLARGVEGEMEESKLFLKVLQIKRKLRKILLIPI